MADATLPDDSAPRRIGNLQLVARQAARYPGRIAAAGAALLVAASATLAIPDGLRRVIDQGFVAGGGDIGEQFRLLLVEDSDTNRMVIQRYLIRVGLASDEARDGQECVDKVRARPHGYYSLIICDIQMPKKNGYETCVEIRQWERENAYPSLPIMALTANAMPEERAAAGAAGFTDYLTKPVDFNRLGRMMITLLDPKIPHTFLKDQNVDTGRPT